MGVLTQGCCLSLRCKNLFLCNLFCSLRVDWCVRELRASDDKVLTGCQQSHNTSYPLATFLFSFPYPTAPSTHHMYPSCPLRPLCSGSSSLYMLLFFCWRCSHFFLFGFALCLCLRCHVSGFTLWQVTSCCSTTGQNHGRDVVRCLRPSVRPSVHILPLPINPKGEGRGLGSARCWCYSWWFCCCQWGPHSL